MISDKQIAVIINPEELHTPCPKRLQLLVSFKTFYFAVPPKYETGCLSSFFCFSRICHSKIVLQTKTKWKNLTQIKQFHTVKKDRVNSLKIVLVQISKYMNTQTCLRLSNSSRKKQCWLVIFFNYCAVRRSLNLKMHKALSFKPFDPTFAKLKVRKGKTVQN